MATRNRKQSTHEPDAPPSCPGCSGTLDMFQPSTDEPDRLLGVCTNADCRQWVLFERDTETGAWRVRNRLQAPVERIVRPRAIA
jgi:hypothetical protein